MTDEITAIGDSSYDHNKGIVVVLDPDSVPSGDKEAEHKVNLANPATIQQYEVLKYLNDKHDANWPAKMLKLGNLPEGYIYPKETRGIRDLLRMRSSLVQK